MRQRTQGYRFILTLWNRPSSTLCANLRAARVCGVTNHLSQHRGVKTDHLLQVPRLALRGGVERQVGAKATTCFYPAPLSLPLNCPCLVKTPEGIRARVASKNGWVSGQFAGMGTDATQPAGGPQTGSTGQTGALPSEMEGRLCFDSHCWLLQVFSLR